MLQKVCRFRHLWAALFAGLLMGSVGCVGKPLVEQVNPGGRRVVLLFDSSTSMRENDPERVALLGGELVTGLVGSEDNLGAITYSATADVQRSMSPVGGPLARAAVKRTLAEVERNGITNFASALDKARAMLEESQAPRGSPIILLTDGVPYRGRRREIGVSLSDVVDSLSENGWPIYAIALTKEAQSPFLSLLVGKTGGSVFPVAEAGGLLETFQDVAVEALGYLRAQRGRTAAEVVPNTRRLAFVARWGESQGSIQAVSKDGAELPGGQVIRTPAGETAIGVGLVEAPEPGRWSAEFSGEPDVVTLVEPTFGLEFQADMPPERVTSLAQVEVAVRILGAPDVRERVREKLSMTARLELNEKSVGASFALAPDPSDPLLFRAKFRAPRVVEESSLRIVVNAVLTEGEGFSLQRSRSFTVRPGDGSSQLDASVTPGQIDRALWAGKSLDVTLDVTGDSKQPVLVRCGKRKLELPIGGSGSLKFKVRRSTRLEVKVLGTDGTEYTQTVPVKLSFYRVRGKQRKGIRLPPIPVGFTSEPVKLDLQAVPKGTLSYARGVVIGPGGARLPVEVQDGAITVTPDPSLPPGNYVGGIPVSLAERPDVGAARLPVKVEVLPPLENPDSVTLRGSWGWSSSPVEVAWPAVRAVPVEIRVGELTGKGSAAGSTIRPDLDVRVRPLDGWSGETLGVSPQRFALEVFVSSDLPAGTYEGTLRLSSKDAGREPLVIPVRLGVAR